jgi:uncharacterized protein YkwD
MSSSSHRRTRLCLAELEPRCVPSGLAPTAQEQLFLEELNDARANPAAYGASIGVDLSGVTPAPPLAFDTRLVAAAQEHSQDMADNHYFAHNVPDSLPAPYGRTPTARLITFGYPLPWDNATDPNGSESIDAGDATTAGALDRLITDAGTNPPDHRIHLLAMDSFFRMHQQIGIGIVQNDAASDYGNYYTIETAYNAGDTRAFLTGVAYQDDNGNGQYGLNEGLGGVTVTVAGVGSTTTFDTGGYSIQLSPGTYTVTATGGGLVEPVTHVVTVGSDNVRLDFVPMPDQMVGPSGVGTQSWVPSRQTLPYSVDFENTPRTGATAVKSAIITTPLDANLDWSTFQLGSIQFGATTVNVPAGRQSYSTSVDTTNVNGTPLRVNVSASLQQQTGVVTWTFQSIDPNTGQPPTDPAAGFLPVDDSTGRGEGSVSFTVQPKANLATGTQINDRASIAFDGNAPVNTDIVSNTIDAGAPISSVQALPAFSPATFTVSWSGQDDAGGSGIARYTIYVSDNGGPFTPFLTGTAQSSATFTGTVGHSYGFYSVATDNVGNVQPTPTAQATTKAVAVEYVVSEFPGQGVKRYSSLAGWQVLSPFDASSVSIDVQGDVAASFPRRSVPPR